MSISLSAEDFRSLQAVNETLLSPLAYSSIESWHDATMTPLKRLFQAEAASFMFTPLQAGLVWNSSGIDQQCKRDFLGAYHFIDPNVRDHGYDSKHSDIFSTTVATGGDIRIYRNTPIYDALFRPYRLEDAVSMVIAPRIRKLPTGSGPGEDLTSDAPHATGTPAVVFGSVRPGVDIITFAPSLLAVYHSRYGTKRFGDMGLELMKLLQPAMRAGVELAQRIDADRFALLRAVNALNDAAWFCSSTGDVLHQNDAMSRLLMADPDRTSLEEALRSALRTLLILKCVRPGKTHEEILPAELPVVRTKLATYRIRGSWLESRGMSRDPGILLLLIRTGAETASADELRERFDLTRREADVALLLARRKRNNEIADQLCISRHTARRHTESVMFKLGVRSRDDVERVIRWR